METLNNKKQRPALLTVVGILSFVGLGYRILTGIINAAMGTVTSSIAPFMQEVFENEADISDAPEPIQKLIEGVFDAITKLLENISGIYITIVLLSVVALLGVIMMWQLKKTGFYLYAAARVLIILVPFIFIGYNLISIVWFSSGLIFAVLFIILYALNLKEMS
ncbi:MAG: hypothetical protein JXB00_19495 [Bacteroidales bacterium]|nr:hypothetical protein [Bacteroidales bacterium]